MAGVDAAAPSDRLSYALTDKDVHKLIPGLPLTLYSDLPNKTLGSLLDNRGRGLVLFVQDKDNSSVIGHWLAVATQPNGLLVFDPYGGKEDPWYLDRKFISNRDQKALDETSPHLSTLIKNAGIRPIYSTERYQEMKKGIETCGRHCVVRLWHKDKDVQRYSRYMSNARYLSGGASNDDIVTHWTDEVLVHGSSPPQEQPG